MDTFTLGVTLRALSPWDDGAAASVVEALEDDAVAWVDAGTERLQVLVDGDRPAPGTVGRLTIRTLDEQPVEVFVADAK